MSHHRLLLRQLKRIGLDEGTLPAQLEHWTEFLSRVSQVYSDADQDRYTNETSLTNLSNELLELKLVNNSFFKQLSEDLRTPLINIVSALQHPDQDILDVIQRNSTLLKTRIDSLLQLSVDAENIARQVHHDKNLLGKTTEQTDGQAPLNDQESIEELIRELTAQAVVRFDENKPHILCVEKEPDYLRYLDKILGGSYNLRFAADAKSALAPLHFSRTEAIIAAENLADQNGLEFLKTVRSSQNLRKIPFILLSSSLSDVYRTEALEAGVSDYLCKPFYERELRARLEKLLNLHQCESKVESELEVSSRIQRAIQPSSPLKLENVELDFLYRPAEHVSGDYYGWRVSGDWLYFYVADITGHGIAASYATFVLHEILNQCFIESPAPALPDLVATAGARYANHHLPKDAAFEIARFHMKTGQLDFCRGNTPAALRITGENNQETISPRSLPGFSKYFLNGIDPAKVPMSTVTLITRDNLFLFTDGCYEFSGDNKSFGRPQFCELLNRLGNRDDWKERLLEELINANGNGFFPDDLTILRLRDKRPQEKLR